MGGIIFGFSWGISVIIVHCLDYPKGFTFPKTNSKVSLKSRFWKMKFPFGGRKAGPISDLSGSVNCSTVPFLQHIPSPNTLEFMISCFQFAGRCDRLKEGSTSIRSTVFVQGLGETQRNWHLIIQWNPLFDVSKSIQMFSKISWLKNLAGDNSRERWKERTLYLRCLHLCTGDFFTDSIMVNHHEKSTIWGICLEGFSNHQKKHLTGSDSELPSRFQSAQLSHFPGLRALAGFDTVFWMMPYVPDGHWRPAASTFGVLKDRQWTKNPTRAEKQNAKCGQQ